MKKFTPKNSFRKAIIATLKELQKNKKCFLVINYDKGTEILVTSQLSDLKIEIRKKHNSYNENCLYKEFLDEHWSIPFWDDPKRNCIELKMQKNPDSFVGNHEKGSIAYAVIAYIEKKHPNLFPFLQGQISHPNY